MRLGAFLAVTALLLAGCCACSSGKSRPNVIVIVLDTVRRDHLSCYGYKRETSPNLDRLAAESVIYERAVSAAPWTFPSHATLFTGLLPSRHHAHHEHLRLDDEQTTLAERLAGAGYETIGFCNNPWITAQLGMTQGFERFEEIWRDRVSKGGFSLNIFVTPEKHGMTDAGAATTLAGIEKWLEGRDSSRPFFLFVNLIEAHSYFDPPEPYRNRFITGVPSHEAVQRENLAYVQSAYHDQLDAGSLTRIQALYDGEIAYLDDWVGRFTSLLKNKKLLDTSLLVVTSDHGEAFAEHRLCGLPLIDHQLSVYRELVDVPLIIRFPSARSAAAEAGKRVDAPVSSADVFPTILDAVGLKPAERLDGTSLAAGPPLAERLLFSEYYRPIVHLGLLSEQVQDAKTRECLVNRRLVAVQSGHRKLILGGPNDPPQLFDRAADPAELAPRAPDSSGADRELFEAAEAKQREMSQGTELAPPALDDAWHEALRSLGYLR